MSEASWICGLMAENYEAVGFIPSTAIERQYVAKGRYIFQSDEQGRRVGYILHGPIKYNRPVFISQHCIQYERRLKGYGEKALAELIRRAIYIGASSIRIRVASDLQAVFFWQSQGFVCEKIVPGGSRRNRQILVMSLSLSLPLFPVTQPALL